VAARLKAEAPAGGIVVSRAVREAVTGRLKVSFNALRELALKNIERPIRAFRVEWSAEDWPAHVVKQVGQELGARYVLEGSVRRAANRVRITGQLIDTVTGAHLWATRFEGTLESVFELQDQVTESAVGAIVPDLEKAEIERARRKPTGSLDAYDYYLRGMASIYQWNRKAHEEALRLFYRAIELDPEYASAYGRAARCYTLRSAHGWMIDRRRETTECVRLAHRAAELGRTDSVALSLAGFALARVGGDLNTAGALLDRALALNPNLASGWMFGGYVKIWDGEFSAGIERLMRAIRLSPSMGRSSTCSLGSR
jgi:tetratricopeptide (TPR) repeat protein